jgi:putative SOS response-associated peptidase YedK
MAESKDNAPQYSSSRTFTSDSTIMCYDKTFKAKISDLLDYFPDVVFDDEIIINPEAAIHIIAHDYGVHPIIFKDVRGDDKLHIRLMEWGCIPYNITNEEQFISSRKYMLNARSEKILDDTNSYWFKIRNRRCLIPVTGIYEHREVKGIKNKIPYKIQLKNQRVFFIPGLYSVAELPDRETGEIVKRWTYTLITRPANEVMRVLHNSGDNPFRMPLFLPLDLARDWVEKDLTVEEYRQILSYEMPSEEIDYHTVYTIRSKKPRPDGKTKDEIYEWKGVPVNSVET